MDREDPAEKRGYLRYFYRNWRPTTVGRGWSHLLAWISGLGLLPGCLITLITNDRQTGAANTTVLVAAQFEGQRYLVSMLGEHSEWVKNVRAAGGRAEIKRKAVAQVRLNEIPLQARAPVLKAWCQVATSGRKHLPVPSDAPISAFEAIAADYPVFRIDPD